jgi:microcystin-dependent protein
VQGAVVGSEAVTLTQLQMAAHTHLAADLSGAGGNSKPDGAVWAGSSLSDNMYTDTLSAGVLLNPATIQNTGGNQPHANMQPYQVVNFIIALEGIYPTQ